ncbi:hypothetical protein SK128_019877, partial [Halocaridina rubra]
MYIGYDLLQEWYERNRAGQESCPHITKDPTMILVHNGEEMSIDVSSNNVWNEAAFSSADFKCQFTVEGEISSVRAQHWYDNIQCDLYTFSYNSTSPKVYVPLNIVWGESKLIDNPNKIHVTIYECHLLAENCKACQELPRDFRCGWCEATENCEFQGKCPSPSWTKPGETCKDVISGEKLLIHEPQKKEFHVQPSDKVVLPCKVSPYFDVNANYWERTHNIKWMRLIDEDVETITNNDFVDVSAYDRHRYTLDTRNSSELEGMVHYDLVIFPLQPGDVGMFQCSVSNKENVTASQTILLALSEPPNY